MPEPLTALIKQAARELGFDAVGISDFPAVFAGEILTRFDFKGAGEFEPAVAGRCEADHALAKCEEVVAAILGGTKCDRHVG